MSTSESASAQAAAADATTLGDVERDEVFDVFISYSRVDIELAILLKTELERRGLKVWLDLQSIAISTKWLAQVERGVNSSNAFLFLLSKHSVQSEVCKSELDYAISANKRIVPVRVGDLDRTLVPAALGEIQWFDWPLDAHDDDRFSRLTTVVRTDYEYVHQHTMFLTRARAWKASGCQRGYLLHGEHLERAVDWLEGARGREPAPVADHTEFIEKSRATSRRAKAIARSSALLGLIALVGALYFSSTAQREAQLSSSRRVAVSALNQVNTSQDQALLLGVAAHGIADTADARSALFASLTHQPSLVTFLHGHAGVIYHIAASADGRLIATASGDNRIILWTTDTWQPVTAPLVGHTNMVWSAAFHPTEPVLATGSVDGTIRFWSTETGASILEPIRPHESYGYVTSLQFSQDGKEILSASVDSTLRRWTYPAGTAIGAPLRGHEGNVWRAVILPDDQTFASCGGRGELRLWERSAGLNTETYALGADAQCELAYSDDGRWIALIAGDQIGVLDASANPRRLRSVGESMPGVFFTAAAFIDDGEVLATARGDDIDFWDVESGERAHPTLRAESGSVRSLLFLKNGNRLVSGGWFRPVVKVWDRTAEPLLLATASAHGKGTMAIGVHPSRREFITAGWDTTLNRWTLEGGRLERATLAENVAEGTRAIVFDATGTRFTTASGTGDVALWSLSGDGATQRTLGKHAGGATVIAAPSDDTFFVSGGEDGALRYWTWEGGAAPYEALGQHSAPVMALDVSADGAFMASGDRDGRLLLWSLEGRRARFVELTAHAFGVTTLAFTPDGEWLVSGGNDGKTKLWAVKSPTPTSIEVDAAANGPVAAAVSPDGRMLAIVADNKMTLVDLSDQPQRVGVIPSPHPASLAALIFSADSKVLVTSSWLPDANLKFWDTDSSLWAVKACAKANRPLTLDESTLAEVSATAICTAGRAGD